MTIVKEPSKTRWRDLFSGTCQKCGTQVLVERHFTFAPIDLLNTILGPFDWRKSVYCPMTHCRGTIIVGRIKELKERIVK